MSMHSKVSHYHLVLHCMYMYYTSQEVMSRLWLTSSSRLATPSLLWPFSSHHIHASLPCLVQPQFHWRCRTAEADSMLLPSAMDARRFKSCSSTFNAILNNYPNDRLDCIKPLILPPPALSLPPSSTPISSLPESTIPGTAAAAFVA